MSATNIECYRACARMALAFMRLAKSARGENRRKLIRSVAAYMNPVAGHAEQGGAPNLSENDRQFAAKMFGRINRIAVRWYGPNWRGVALEQEENK